MARPGPATQAKRQRERAKKEKRLAKEEARAQRKEEKARNSTPGLRGHEIDLLGIVPGPQKPVDE